MSDANNVRAYAGRWVALVQGRVAGVGLTAEAAAAAAQLSRPEEKPQVIFVPASTDREYTHILETVERMLPKGGQVWLVGGAVRDALLRRTAHDLDFVVAGSALSLARAAADALQAAFYPLDEERDVGRVVVKRGAEEPFVLDFAHMRGSTLEADLGARDFTINAMAAPVAALEALIDPLHGVMDLRAKLIRLCSPTAIVDDPVRGVRAVRLAAKLGFHIDKEARAAIRAGAAGLANVSLERRRDEFIQCVSGPRASAAVRALDLLDLLTHLVPELLALRGLSQPSDKHTLDGWEHSLATVAWLEELLAVLGPVHDEERAADLTLGLAAVKLGRYRQALAGHLDQRLDGDRPARWMLKLAALLHDIGKPATWSQTEAGVIHFYEHEQVGAELAGRRLTELRFSNEEIRRGRTIIAGHMRPTQMAHAGHGLTHRMVYRFFRDTSEAGVDIVLLNLADFLAHFGSNPPPQDQWEQRLGIGAQLLNAYFEKHEERVAPPPLLTGRDLMKGLGLSPGPQVGRLLEAVREAQAAGEVHDREGALALAKQVLKDGK
jgi:poly(A) polymerase